MAAVLLVDILQILSKKGYQIVSVDVKNKKSWFQINSYNKNIRVDCRDPLVCDRIVKGVDYIFNLACDMGGMGFIENNKALCMLSSVININLLQSAKKYKVKKFFYSSSACVYPSYRQKDFIKPQLKSLMHILLIQKMDMVGRNCSMKECVDIFMRILGWKQG